MELEFQGLGGRFVHGWLLSNGLARGAFGAPEGGPTKKKVLAGGPREPGRYLSRLCSRQKPRTRRPACSDCSSAATVAIGGSYAHREHPSPEGPAFQLLAESCDR